MSHVEFTAEEQAELDRIAHLYKKSNGNGKDHDDKDYGCPPQEPPSLPRIDIAKDPIPPREWAVRDRIPARNVALLSGEGAIGKSTLLLQLAASTVLTQHWLGTMPEPGPVMYMGCEDEGDEDRRRLQDIAEYYGSSREEMKRNGLFVYDFVGKDAILGEPNRNDRIVETQLFKDLKAEAKIIKPKMFMVDTVSDVFAGRENDRGQTRQFITLMRGLAIESGAAVILASHPSLTGISSDTGLSGTTQWHNGPRARGYFKQATNTEDDGLRVLEWRKNNYGPISESILLRWRNGVYVPEPRVGSLEMAATEQKTNDIFCAQIIQFNKQGRNVSAKRNAPTYAPSEFAKEKEAKDLKLRKADFEAAMRRLLAAGKIRVEPYGPPSRGWTRLVVV